MLSRMFFRLDYQPLFGSIHTLIGILWGSLVFSNFVDYHFAALVTYNNDILIEIITPTSHLFVLERKICNQIGIREIKYRPVDIFLMQE